MKNKKIVSIILIIFLVLNMLQNFVNAVDINMNETYIENLGQCEMHLQYWKESDKIWSYIVTTMVGYRINNNLHYAYCLQQDRKGVGGNQESYNVKISELLKDEKIWRAIINGFPYKTASELGVANDQDAFVATKQAIYCVIYDWNVDTRYRGADERGWQIVNAIKNIVQEAKNGTQTPNTSNILNINKLGEFKRDLNGFYSQEFTVTSTVEMNNYTISNLNNFPQGTFSADMSNNPKTQFSPGEHFKILVPSKNILNDFNGKIKIDGEVKTYPIFYGASYNSSLQDYALTYNSFDIVSEEIFMQVDAHKSSIKIIKTDAENNIPISNVEFNFKYSDGTNIGNFLTDENGIINISGLKQGKILVTEIKTQKQYILDENSQELTLEYNSSTQAEFTNSRKKGNLKIIKTDKDNNNILLSGVKFNLIDSNGKIIASLVTDSKGEAEIKNLDIGNYILKEISTNEDYNISLDKNVIIEWGKNIEIKIENEKIKGQIKIIKTSEDDNLISGNKAGSPIENVKFEIYDSNGNIVDTLITDKDGIAISKPLVKGIYTIKEVQPGNGYLLNENIFSTQIINNGEIVEVEITNKSETPIIENVPKLPKTGC